MKPTVKAKYVRESLCDCGYHALNDNIPLGKQYTVIPSSLKNATLICGGCAKPTTIKAILAWDDDANAFAWFPAEVLELQECIH